MIAVDASFECAPMYCSRPTVDVDQARPIYDIFPSECSMTTRHRAGEDPRGMTKALHAGPTW